VAIFVLHYDEYASGTSLHASLHIFDLQTTKKEDVTAVEWQSNVHNYTAFFGTEYWLVAIDDARSKLGCCRRAVGRWTWSLIEVSSG
jgi:hypothetical protein